MRKAFVMISATVCTVTLTVLVGVASRQEAPAVQDAVVEFGFPQHPQPPAPHNHVLLPDDVTIVKGGTVTFRMNGGGHGLAIYPVSKNTTRGDIAEDLCQGGPEVCNVPNGTAALPYTITDGHGEVVIQVAEFPTDLRVDSTPGQLFSVGGAPGVLLIGSTATTRGVQVRYRFPDHGRYLVICINRVHVLNDGMFGFVNVK